VLLGQVLATVLTLATNAFLARLLSHDSLGAYFLIFSIALFGSMIAQLGLDRTVVRLVAAGRATHDYGRARDAIRLTFRFGAVGSIGVAAVLLLGSGQLASFYGLHAPGLGNAMAFVAGWMVTLTLQSLTAETFRGLQRFWLATLFSGLAVDACSVIAFGGVWLAGVHVTLREALGLTIGMTALAAGVGAAAVRRRASRLRGPGEAHAREMLSISWPLLATSIASFVTGVSVDLWVVAHFRPASDVAIYAAASRLVFFVATAFMIASQVVPPIVAELHAQGRTADMERALRSVSTITGIPAAVVLLTFTVAGGEVLGALYGPFYRQGATVLLILSCARMIAVCTGSCGAALMMTGHQRTMMTIMAGSAIGGLAGEVLLAPVYGIVGVAAATATAQTAQNLSTLLFARARLGIWTHARLSPRPVVELFGVAGRS
jgi:O-antigen/teichoic acid export membrane protein